MSFPVEKRRASTSGSVTKTVMRRFLTHLVLLLLLVAAPRETQAVETSVIERHAALLGTAQKQLQQVAAARSGLLARLGRYQGAIEATRSQAPSPARDYKLRQLLAKTQALSKQLSTLDGLVRRFKAELGQHRTALLTLLVQVTPDQAAIIRRAIAATLPHPARDPGVLRVPRVNIGALDGPRDIEEKADLLKDSEEKIRRRLKELDEVILRIEARQKLRRIADQVDRDDGLFAEDASRHRITRLRPGSSGRTSEADGAYGLSDNPAPTGTTPGAFVGAGSSAYSVVLREVLSPATLEALRSAGRSTDPAVRLQALARVRAELQKKALELQQREREYRDRARSLRRHEQMR
jgi:hypothetical protein